MHSPELFFSHSMDRLADALATHLVKDGVDLFSPCFIVIPSRAVKEWVQFELAKRLGQRGILGLSFVRWQEGIRRLGVSLPLPSRMTLLAALWSHGQDRILERSEGQRLALNESLADLALSGFAWESKEHWIAEWLEGVLLEFGWETTAQVLSKTPIGVSTPFYVFGTEWLPEPILRFFLRHSQARFFRFSPCALFWEESRSQREQKNLLRHAGNEALQGYLAQLNPLLSNWGVMGRRQLACFGEEIQTDEDYGSEEEESTLLEQLQGDLLWLRPGPTHPRLNDRSLLVVPCGVSKIREVEWVRDEILRSQIPFDEIRIYAPSIQEYAPLLEFVFGSIPFRIAGVLLSQKSSFYGALQLLFRCVKGRWSSAELLSLFEAPAFYRKAGWDLQKRENLREWIDQAEIREGLDGEHRAESTGIFSNAGIWAQGLDLLVDHWVWLALKQKHSVPWSEADGFEDFFDLFDRLKERVFSWREEKTLSAWADELEQTAAEFLVWDETNEADRVFQGAFYQFITSLRHSSSLMKEATFSFSWIERQLPVVEGGEGGMLHGVRCASLEEGSILPAKLVFAIGMEEGNFPKMIPSPLAKVVKTGAPSQGEKDRFLMLQLLFAAQKRLVITYGSLSPDDGKPVEPSLLVQELLSYTQAPVCPLSPKPSSSSIPSSLYQTTAPTPVTTQDRLILLTDLNRFLRSPVQYWLEQVLGLRFPDPSPSPWALFEWSPLMQSRWTRAFVEKETSSVDWPVGIWGQAAQKKMEGKALEYRDSLAKWEIDPNEIQTLSFIEKPFEVKLSSGAKISLIGEVPLVTSKGVLCLGEDSIRGAMKKWGEMLVALSASSQSQIFFLQTGRIREVTDPLKGLQGALELYLQCQSSPLLFDPEWANEVLRQNKTPASKEGRALQWVLQRSPSIELAQEFSLWGPLLKEKLAPLIALFPTRGSDANV